MKSDLEETSFQAHDCTFPSLLSRSTESLLIVTRYSSLLSHIIPTHHLIPPCRLRPDSTTDSLSSFTPVPFPWINKQFLKKISSKFKGETQQQVAHREKGSSSSSKTSLPVRLSFWYIRDREGETRAKGETGPKSEEKKKRERRSTQGVTVISLSCCFHSAAGADVAVIFVATTRCCVCESLFAAWKLVGPTGRLSNVGRAVFFFSPLLLFILFHPTTHTHLGTRCRCAAATQEQQQRLESESVSSLISLTAGSPVESSSSPSLLSSTRHHHLNTETMQNTSLRVNWFPPNPVCIRFLHYNNTCISSSSCDSCRDSSFSLCVCVSDDRNNASGTGPDPHPWIGVRGWTATTKTIMTRPQRHVMAKDVFTVKECACVSSGHPFRHAIVGRRRRRCWWCGDREPNRQSDCGLIAW